MASLVGLYRPERLRASRTLLAVGLAALSGALVPCAARTEPPAIPEHNRADLQEAPTRPAAADASAQAAKLFEAIVQDKPEAAESVFFPRAAFLLVKDVVDPGRYFDQLHRRFIADVHALHARLPGLAAAQFERFELSQRGGFMKVHEEGNRLPYWAARHNHLFYRSAGQTHDFEVRVLITWDDRWYVIHLNEFH